MINPSDLKIDIMREEEGGMLTGKLPPGVIVTHLPTKISIASWGDRHQHNNRKIALDILESHLKNEKGRQA